MLCTSARLSGYSALPLVICCKWCARERACADGDAYTRLDVCGLAEDPAGDRTPWHSRSLQQPSQLIRCAQRTWQACMQWGSHGSWT